MRRLLFAVLSLGIGSAFAANTCPPPTPQLACAQIGSAVETFRLAIIKKDRASFLSLMFSETIPWIGVTTDNSLKMVAARQKLGTPPDAEKIYASSNPVQFIDNIVKRTAAVEETFDNVRIESDGDIAQVYFDYSFNSDGYKSNWGKESWHMVRTATGWKINSVIWTMEFNPLPPPRRPGSAPSAS